MAINVTFPGTSPATIADLADIIDFIAIDGNVTSVSPTEFSGDGIFNGQAATFTVTGSGFTPGQIDGIDYIVAGVIDTITMSVGGVTLMTMTSVDIDLAVFTPIIHDDDTGGDPLAIENFLLGLAWNFTLNDLDDVVTSTTLVGDGAFFNMTGDDFINAGGGNDNLFSGDGNDTMRGDAGNDTLDGGAGNDRLFGRADRDLLIGGTGDDALYGGSARDTLFGGSDNDELNGGKGRDRLEGGTGDDLLLGDGGHDNLFGQAGNDTLEGGAGNDRLTGGNNADDFIFADGFGNDTIVDFAATNDNEDIDLSAVTSIVDFNDLLNNHMTQVGADVVIDALGGNTITLLNVNLGDLGDADFIF